MLVVCSSGTERPEPVQNPVEGSRSKIGADCGCDESDLGAENINARPVHEETKRADNAKAQELVDNFGTGAGIKDTAASQGGVSVTGEGCSNVKWEELQMP